MDTKTLSLPPYEFNQIEQLHNVVRVRNFRQLLATLATRAIHEQGLSTQSGTQVADNGSDSERETDDDGLVVMIYPAGQMIQLEARAHDVSSFNVNADLLCIFGDGRNRWLDYNKKPCAPPLPLKVPRLVMSPALCDLWRTKLSPTPYRTSQLSAASASALHLNNDLMHLIIVQGQSASECRRFIAVETFHEAASTIFNELTNGYAVVFVGLMFKSEFENRMLQGKAYQICKSFDELRRWQVHHHTATTTPSRAATPSNSSGKDTKDSKKGKDIPEEPKKYLGIIC